ncbi:unnamed protein product [Amoebophrya sp. A25]|nr:unnamed protein product [Amoebophrya sp. A25]|eukprot:GSA25T00017603001.1
MINSHAHNREEKTSWEPVHAGIFDFTFRNSKPVDGFPGGAPAPQAHCDFSKESGLTRMKRVLEGNEAVQHTWTYASTNVAQEQGEGSSFGVPSGGIRSPSNCFFNTEKQFRDFVYHELPLVSVHYRILWLCF